MHDYEFKLIKLFLFTRSILLLAALAALAGFVFMVVRYIGLEVNSTITTVLGITVGAGVMLLEKLGGAVSRDIGELLKELRSREREES